MSGRLSFIWSQAGRFASLSFHALKKMAAATTMSRMTSHHLLTKSDMAMRMAAPNGIFAPGVLWMSWVSCGMSVVTKTMETPMPARMRKAG